MASCSCCYSYVLYIYLKSGREPFRNCRELEKQWVITGASLSRENNETMARVIGPASSLDLIT